MHRRRDHAPGRRCGVWFRLVRLRLAPNRRIADRYGVPWQHTRRAAHEPCERPPRTDVGCLCMSLLYVFWLECNVFSSKSSSRSGPSSAKVKMKSGTRPCRFRAGMREARWRPACGMQAAKSPYTSVRHLTPISLASSVSRHFRTSCWVRQPSPGKVAVVRLSPYASKAAADRPMRWPTN